MSACLLCREPADDLHHVTGRGIARRQLDDDCVVPLCHDDHELIHDDLRAECLDKPLRKETAVEEVARRLERTSVLLGRVAEAVPAVCSLGYLARAMRFWADQLHKFVHMLDERFPSWREGEDS